MLIVTQGTLDQIDHYTYNLYLNFPKIYLDKNDYKIGVRMITFQNNKIFPVSKFTLHTSAIDKNALNPEQELLSFMVSGSSYIFYNPRNILEYKIQLKEVHTADFTLSCTRPVNLFEIDHLEIIFEITRDARIQ